MRRPAQTRSAPEPEGWLYAALPLMRDVALIGAILFYVIGFAYQTAQMQRLAIASGGADVQANVVLGAADAIREGAFVYAALAAGALALLLVAGLIKRALANHALGSALATATLAVSVLVSVVGASCFAWSQGISDRPSATPASPAAGPSGE